MSRHIIYENQDSFREKQIKREAMTHVCLSLLNWDWGSLSRPETGCSWSLFTQSPEQC